MARSLIQRRQEAERARAEAYDASLRRMSQPPRPAPNFHHAIEEAHCGFEASVLRDPSAWRPQMKTRDPARLRLAAARHLFARYPVASHLEQVWTVTGSLAPAEIRLRKHWYIVAASGGSLFKEAAGHWLSRKEVHAFLTTPAGLSFDEAFWHAISRSYASNPGIALRIARSKIAQTDRSAVAFWREAARFFCANPVSIEELNDYCDFLADSYQRNPQLSLKGRTLASLGRQMCEWHRDLEAIARIEAAQRRAQAAAARGPGQPLSPQAAGNVAWAGAAIADWSWTPSAKDRSRREEYLVTQLRTAVCLVAETRAMHHCVATYAAKCIAGNASIWSLRRRAAGDTTRLLTIELNREQRAVQVRGFANRLATLEERKLLERWAKARNIGLP